MKKILVSIAVIAAYFIGAPFVYALGSTHGIIDQTYDYQNLEVREVEGQGNYISGTFINKTNSVHDNVCISIYGLDYFDKILWKEVVFMDVIDKNGKFNFRNHLGREKEPSKISFQVTEGPSAISQCCPVDKRDHDPSADHRKTLGDKTHKVKPGKYPEKDTVKQ